MTTITASSKLARVGQDLQAALTAELPVLATERGQIVKPLALGAGPMMLNLTKGSRSKLRKLIRAYTQRSAYLRALAAEGAERHYLNGEVAGPVSDQHRADAVELLRTRKIVDSKRRKQADRQRPKPPVHANQGATL